MSSGIYSALTGAVAKMQNLDLAVNNLANVGNVGFKGSRVSFESIYDERIQNTHGLGKNFARTAGRFVDFSQGDIERSGRPLDMAIKGDGFFKVASEDGFFYTRKGDFRIDENGSLVTGTEGLQVVGEEGPVFVPHSDIHIDKRGNITADGEPVGRLTIYDIEDRDALRQQENGLWGAAQDNADRPSEDSEVIQGSLEQANVSALRLTTEIIEINRSYAAYMQTMKIYSELAEKARSIGEIG